MTTLIDLYDLKPSVLATLQGFELTATGTGASQTIALPTAATAAQLLVFVNGVKKLPTAYSVSGTTLTITTNASGDQIEVVLPSGNTGVKQNGIGFSVGANTAANAVIPGAIAINALSVATSGMQVVVFANPTAAQTWTLKKRAAGGTVTTLGTIAFATSGAVTLSIAAFSLAVGDACFLVGPSAQDATLAFSAQFTGS